MQANALTQKIGPLPMWGWAAGAGGLMLAVVAVRKLRGASSTSTTPAATSYGPLTRDNLADAFPGGGGGSYGGGPGSGDLSTLTGLLGQLVQQQQLAQAPPTTPPPAPTPTQPARTAPAMIALSPGETVGASNPLANVVGVGFTNTYEGNPAAGWVPQTQLAGSVQAPPGGVLQYGQWSGNVLTSGTYKLPDGSYTSVKAA